MYNRIIVDKLLLNNLGTGTTIVTPKGYQEVNELPNPGEDDVIYKLLPKIPTWYNGLSMVNVRDCETTEWYKDFIRRVDELVPKRESSSDMLAMAMDIVLRFEYLTIWEMPRAVIENAETLKQELLAISYDANQPFFVKCDNQFYYVHEDKTLELIASKPYNLNVSEFYSILFNSKVSGSNYLLSTDGELPEGYDIIVFGDADATTDYIQYTPKEDLTENGLSGGIYVKQLKEDIAHYDAMPHRGLEQYHMIVPKILAQELINVDPTDQAYQMILMLAVVFWAIFRLFDYNYYEANQSEIPSDCLINQLCVDGKFKVRKVLKIFAYIMGALMFAQNDSWMQSWPQDKDITQLSNSMMQVISDSITSLTATNTIANDAEFVTLKDYQEIPMNIMNVLQNGSTAAECFETYGEDMFKYIGLLIVSQVEALMNTDSITGLAKPATNGWRYVYSNNQYTNIDDAFNTNVKAELFEMNKGNITVFDATNDPVDHYLDELSKPGYKVSVKIDLTDPNWKIEKDGIEYYKGLWRLFKYTETSPGSYSSEDYTYLTSRDGYEIRNGWFQSQNSPIFDTVEIVNGDYIPARFADTNCIQIQTLILNDSIKEIGNWAFERVNKIVYRGTFEQFSQIKGNSYGYNNLELECLDGSYFKQAYSSTGWQKYYDIKFQGMPIEISENPNCKIKKILSNPSGNNIVKYYVPYKKGDLVTIDGSIKVFAGMFRDAEYLSEITETYSNITLNEDNTIYIKFIDPAVVYYYRSKSNVIDNLIYADRFDPSRGYKHIAANSVPGLIFKYWGRSTTASAEYTQAPTSGSSTYLYAVYEPATVIYHVTEDGKDTIYQIGKVNHINAYHSQYAKMVVPSDYIPPMGYNFDGWYYTSDYNEANKVSTNTTLTVKPVNGVYHLYAKITPITYTIDFDFDGGQLRRRIYDSEALTSGEYILTTETFQDSWMSEYSMETLNHGISYEIKHQEDLPRNSEGGLLSNGYTTMVKEGYEFIGFSGTDLDGLVMEFDLKEIVLSGKVGNKSYKANWKIKE